MQNTPKTYSYFGKEITININRNPNLKEILKENELQENEEESIKENDDI